MPLTNADGVTVPKSEVRARSQIVAVRLTPEEKRVFTAFAVRRGQSLPDLMRLAVETVMYQEAMHQ